MSAPAPEQTPTMSGGEVDHMVCDCDPDTAFCGEDVADLPWSHTRPTCVLCEVVYETTGCPQCQRCPPP